MAGRDYRAGRPSYPDRYDEPDPFARQRSRREYQYDSPNYPPRGSTDGMSRVISRSDYGSANAVPATRTTYRVSRPQRDADARLGEGKVIVLDSRLDGDRDLSDWEIVRPERSESGAYVIETSSSSTSDYGKPGGRAHASTLGSDIEIISPPRGNPREYGRERGRRQRSLSRGTMEAMREVRVTEDYSSDDGGRSIVSRRTARPSVPNASLVVAPPLTGIPSSLRHDHSPESATRRRSRSIGFIKNQISHHDAGESRHERPGAEANVAGTYLIHHRGERVGRRNGGSDEDDSTSISDYPPPRKSRTDVVDRYEVEKGRRGGRDDDYRRYSETVDDPYPPQRSSRRYRGGRERGREDYYDKVYERGRSKRYD